MDNWCTKLVLECWIEFFWLRSTHIRKTQKQLYFTILVYFLVLVYFLLFIYFYVLIPKPYAWKPQGGVGDTRQWTCFAGCLTRTEEAFLTVPREFDIKPRVTLVGNLLLIHHVAFGVPTNWHTCLVSSRLLSGAVTEEQRKAFTTTIFRRQDYFLVPQDLLMAPCNFLSLGRVHHCESSWHFRHSKHFSLFCFCLFCLVVYFQYYLYFSYTK
jgi:hypothetical protein